ncbi:MAG: proton-conducting membrane transporter [Tissierella sp.]|nr:proton-conducting membrane transporter [Tissierella sp.]
MKGNILLLVPIIFPIIIGLVIKEHDIRKYGIRKIHRLTASMPIINMFILIGLFMMENHSLGVIGLNNILSIRLYTDEITKFFTILTTFIWILVTFYSFEYMSDEKNVKSFYMFLSISYGLVLGLGFAGNMFTYYLFYEFMTLFTFPLVIHSKTKDSMKAGIKYLAYSFSGAALVLIGIIFTYYHGVDTEFRSGGILNPDIINNNITLIIYLLTFIGFGSKAGMYPLHAWLPNAHPVAPAPASGILSGIITKAGVLGIIRFTFYVYGANTIRGSWVQTTILILSIFTIFMGSMLAFRTKELKKRLAFSSVSQVSYILFGIALLSREGFIGALSHMTFHAILKNILFLGAGAIIYKADKYYTHELKGIGKQMPITMWTFTIASLALIGIPPLSGFISKWYLGLGGLGFTNYTLGVVGVVTLIVSALLTGGYLIPIFVDAFFPGQDYNYNIRISYEPTKFMTIPLIILTVVVVLLGIFPNFLIVLFNNIALSIL